MKGGGLTKVITCSRVYNFTLNARHVRFALDHDNTQSQWSQLLYQQQQANLPLFVDFLALSKFQVPLTKSQWQV